MITRRDFVRSAGLAGVALAGASATSEVPQGDLPPAIAALSSMKGKERPITADERRGRIERARRLMTEQKIDALMLCSGSSLVYFTNIRWSGGARADRARAVRRGQG